MPLTSASDYLSRVAYDLLVAEEEKKPVAQLDQRLSHVSNSLSGSQSAINNASRALAAELAPVLLEALQHEQAARGPIENAFDTFTINITQMGTLYGQLLRGRFDRDGFKDGETLLNDSRELYKAMFETSESLTKDPVIGTKHAEAALAHAESLAQQLESRLPQ